MNLSDIALSVFLFDPETGIFINKNRRSANAPAGCVGYYNTAQAAHEAYVAAANKLHGAFARVG